MERLVRIQEAQKQKANYTTKTENINLNDRIRDIRRMSTNTLGLRESHREHTQNLNNVTIVSVDQLPNNDLGDVKTFDSNDSFDINKKYKELDAQNSAR